VTEQQPYTVIRTLEQFEVRSYPAHMLVQVNVRGGLDAGAGAGFGPLFRYISGANQSQRSFAMTAPVLQQRTGEQEQTVSFVLPAGVGATNAPAPTDPRVRTMGVEPRVVAARRFRGSARGRSFTDQGKQLITAVQAAGLEPIGEAYYARFDPPWMPGFLRHNEALVEVTAAAS
jgi:hypothetical protein